MAQSTRDIKRRIRGISNTKQITKAMELVSTAKMRKTRLRLEKSRPYYNTVLNSISNVLGNVNMRHPLLTAREVKKTLYIVVTADRGLAGGYNANINRLVESVSKKDKDATVLLTVGLKSRDYFKSRGYNIAGEFLGITETPGYSDARMIGEKAVELYLKGEADEINIVFTKFISTLSYEPTVLKLLPFEVKKSDDKGTTKLIEFEPSPEEALDYLIPKYVESTIFGALIEASSSEQAARRAAMESATENAEEMIEDLNMSYNRARQAAITMELTEIVAGAEALK